MANQGAWSIRVRMPGWVLGWLCSGLLITTLQAQDLTGVKCIVDGTRSCQTAWSQKYLQGDLYFSSGDALVSFRQRIEEDPADHLSLRIRAHHQLLLTGQYVQRYCPITLRTPSPQFTARVGGLQIAFADAQARDQVLSEPRLVDKARRVFHPEVFATAFVPLPAVQMAAGEANPVRADFD